MDTHFEKYRLKLEGKLVCLNRTSTLSDAVAALTLPNNPAGLVIEMIPKLHPYAKKPIHRAGAKVLWSNGTVSWVTCSSLVVHPDTTADT